MQRYKKNEEQKMKSEELYAIQLLYIEICRLLQKTSLINLIDDENRWLSALKMGTWFMSIYQTCTYHIPQHVPFLRPKLSLKQVYVRYMIGIC